MATISYNNTQIADVPANSRATLQCAGKKMEGDIVVSIPPNPTQELTKGTIYIVDQDAGSTSAYGFILGMDWTLFLETVGVQVGFESEDGTGFITQFGNLIYLNGGPVSTSDAVIDNASYYIY